MTSEKKFAALTEEITNTLRFLAEIGCQGFESASMGLETVKQWGSRKGALKETLEMIRADLGDCQRCRLAQDRKNIVFGDGDRHARLVFVGEAPGYNEDQKGKPFVGAAGELLTRIIQAMKLSREQVYICNIIKCRPPGNRNPLADEIKACSPFVDRQIDAIKPAVICALGTFAAQTLLGTSDSISRLRGRFRTYQGILVMPTFHPAYLLHNPDKKRFVWEDIQKVMKVLR
jgi:DNA polymerase